MYLRIAIIKQNESAFVLMAATRNVLSSTQKREQMLHYGEQLYPGIPIVLIGQDGRGGDVFFGPSELVAQLVNQNLYPIPWSKMSIPADPFD